MKKNVKLILFFLTVAVVVSTCPINSLAQDIRFIDQPSTLGEAKSFMGKILKAIPRATQDAWRTASDSWGKGWKTVKKLWNKYITPILQNVWVKIRSFFQNQFEIRKTVIQQELEKEKEEVKVEIKEEIPGFWQKIKSIF